MSELLKSPKQIEEKSPGYNKVVLWAIDYKDAHDEMGFEVTVPQLIEMLLSFKKQFVDVEWYNAGIMAQRILQNDEIEKLKHNLKLEEERHMNTRVSWDSTTAERDELKNRCVAIEDRIKILSEQKEQLKNMLEDVVNVLDLSNETIEKHSPLGTAPSELVKAVIEEKNLHIKALENGMIQIKNK